jgi:phosphatidylinositol alpha-1,6-mannosyltransferase
MLSKTLLISEIFPPLNGGSGRWFIELYSRLPRNDFSIAAGNTAGANEFDLVNNLDITRLNLSSRYWGVINPKGLYFYISQFFKLRKLIKQKKIRAIHCGRCLPEGVFGYMFKKLLGLPYICYVHGEDIETASTSRELSMVINKVLSNASILISNSKNTRDILINHWNVDHEKIRVLNPGMDANRFVPAEYEKDVRMSLGWGDRPVLLTVGRLQKRKGQDILIRALPAIKRAIPDILYVVIGGGEEKSNLLALVEENSLNDNVRFMDEVADAVMINCYQQCTLFVLPNRTINNDIEGFGMVLAEAQACGKPVIAGDSGGTSETMIIGKTGFIVDCTTPEPLAEKIVDLLRDQETLIEMGKQARIHATNNLDWNEHTKKALTIFNSLNP